MSPFGCGWFNVVLNAFITSVNNSWRRGVIYYYFSSREKKVGERETESVSIPMALLITVFSSGCWNSNFIRKAKL